MKPFKARDIEFLMVDMASSHVTNNQMPVKEVPNVFSRLNSLFSTQTSSPSSIWPLTADMGNRTVPIPGKIPEYRLL